MEGGPPKPIREEHLTIGQTVILTVDPRGEIQAQVFRGATYVGNFKDDEIPNNFELAKRFLKEEAQSEGLVAVQSKELPGRFQIEGH